MLHAASGQRQPIHHPIPLLDGFNVYIARPSYLVNCWLTAMLSLYRSEIGDLIRQHDATLAAH